MKKKEIKELLIDKKKAIVEFPGNYSDSSEGEDEEEVDEKNINLDNKQESNVFSQFILEVRESMQELIENERTTKLNDSEFSNLKLEINSCKLAYNIPMDELPRLIFLSFIGITQQQLALFKKTFDQWMVLWNFYFKKPETRIGMLHAIEDFSLENDHFIRIIPNILHFINQEKEFIEDEQIILWYSSLTENSTLRSIPKLKELIEWLGKEEEEEDDD
ncbi:W2 domain-containing protein [Meloidogyne graminicola]|uniref:W2 domain-containing protein n=1 Tax=Meloidogyne graminicola TaxID=189291 RepID=A0A8S9ZTG5_9BILA|nr:W2 domain-containing protein [Meloidogyne graminicola]